MRIWQATLVLALCFPTACGNAPCGPGDAPSSGIAVTAGQLDFIYGQFRSSANNDCTPPGANVTSMTIDSLQVTDEGSFFLTLCIPRPDEVGSAPLNVGLTDNDEVRIVNTNGTLEGCALLLDFGTEPNATATFSGFCDDGSSEAGYSLALDGDINVTLDCGMGPQAQTATLSGVVAVGAI